MNHTLPGLAATRGVKLVVGRRTEALSPAGLRLLLDRSEIMHEGEVTHDRDGTHYYGSTMFTLDLARMTDSVEGTPDDEQCRLIATHLRASPFFRAYLMRLARREVHRRLGTLPLIPLRAQMRVRAEGIRLFADLDVEIHGMKDQRLSG